MLVTANRRYYLRMLAELILLAIAIFALGSLLVHAQTPARGAPQIGISDSTDQEPLLREYRGVRLGMSAEEARSKLGAPADKSDRQDFYTVSETESAQIFYDDARRVRAVSAHYAEGAAAPAPKSIFGVEVERSADGSVYKLVNYRRAGYWVSYSRSAGDRPVVSVSMQTAP